MDAQTAVAVGFAATSSPASLAVLSRSRSTRRRSRVGARGCPCRSLNTLEEECDGSLRSAVQRWEAKHDYAAAAISTHQHVSARISNAIGQRSGWMNLIWVGGGNDLQRTARQGVSFPPGGAARCEMGRSRISGGLGRLVECAHGPDDGFASEDQPPPPLAVAGEQDDAFDMPQAVVVCRPRTGPGGTSPAGRGTVRYEYSGITADSRGRPGCVRPLGQAV